MRRLLTLLPVGIADGDMITVLKGLDPAPHPALGHRPPENGHHCSSRAEQTASTPAFGKQVTIRADDTDRYGRTVAYRRAGDC